MRVTDRYYVMDNRHKIYRPRQDSTNVSTVHSTRRAHCSFSLSNRVLEIEF